MGNPADDIPGRHKPARAEPDQPDKPFSGDKKERAQPDSESDSARRQKSQSDDALSNVRNDT